MHSPVDEDHRTWPVDVNGVAKLAGEQLHMVYANAHRMPITSLRLTNVYGPRQRLDQRRARVPAGVHPAGPARRGDPRSSATARSDATACTCDDVVDALVAATDDETVGQVFNVGQRSDDRWPRSRS